MNEFMARKELSLTSALHEIGRNRLISYEIRQPAQP